MTDWSDNPISFFFSRLFSSSFVFALLKKKIFFSSVGNFRFVIRQFIFVTGLKDGWYFVGTVVAAFGLVPHIQCNYMLSRWEGKRNVSKCLPKIAEISRNCILRLMLFVYKSSWVWFDVNETGNLLSIACNNPWILYGFLVSKCMACFRLHKYYQQKPQTIASNRDYCIRPNARVVCVCLADKCNNINAQRLRSSLSFFLSLSHSWSFFWLAFRLSSLCWSINKSSYLKPSIENKEHILE